MLIVRRLLGLGGAALVANAVNRPGCTSATQIEVIDSMIADRSLRLDGSGNAPTALSDRLMLVRAMVGVTGTGVTTLAIAGTRRATHGR